MMKYFKKDWCELDWTFWVGFNSTKSQWEKLPASQGMYRVRPVGINFLVYVGQTGRNLRQRLRSLRRNVLAELMPYNDPHTAAPNLWVWRKELGLRMFCSYD